LDLSNIICLSQTSYSKQFRQHNEDQQHEQDTNEQTKPKKQNRPNHGNNQELFDYPGPHKTGSSSFTKMYGIVDDAQTPNQE
jgi:hypothetical protein